MKLLLLLLIPFWLFAAKILSYNVYERSERVDVMLTFDTPFEGKLSQVKRGNTLVLKLQGASIESPRIKNINTPYLHKMTITPINSHTEIVLQTAAEVTMQASKTSDAYGLRLRFLKKPLVKKQAESDGPSLVPSTLPTKVGNDFKNSYYIVIAILLLGIVLMLWLKKKMGVPQQQKGKQPWLFKSLGNKEGISVRFQKALDPKNRVAMLDYEGESYLVLLGSSNVLLDKFSEGKPIRSQNEFEQVLSDNRAQLDAYLHLDNPDEVEPLQSYKQKASSQIHELV